jgi:hypothetical protein
VSDDNMSGYQCVLAFDSDDHKFIRGFEAARIWEAAKRDLTKGFTETVHVENAEMMLRIAEATGREVVSSEDGGWMHCSFAPSTSPPDWLEESE